MSENKGSALRGLAAYQERKDEIEAAREEAKRGKFNRFALLKAGDEATVRFGQELDTGAKGYSDKQGIGFVNLEHNHPDPTNGWKNRANCTINSQGACYPDEMASDKDVEWDKRKKWKAKEKFYINVIGGEPKEVKNGDKTKYLTGDIDEKTGDGEVYLLEQGTYNGIYDALAKSAIKRETITDTFWTISRKGSNFNDTQYILTRGDEIPKDAKALDDFELVDIDDQLREVDYAKQEAFYWNGIDRGVAINAGDDPITSKNTEVEGNTKKDEW